MRHIMITVGMIFIQLNTDIRISSNIFQKPTQSPFIIFGRSQNFRNFYFLSILSRTVRQQDLKWQKNA